MKELQAILKSCCSVSYFPCFMFIELQHFKLNWKIHSQVMTTKVNLAPW